MSVLNRLKITVFIIFLITVSTGARSLKVLEEKNIPVSPGEKLHVEASSGDVKIVSWDKNEVYVKIMGNKKAASKMEFSIEKTAAGVEVICEKEGAGWGDWFSGISLKLEIKVPRQFNTKIMTSGGDLMIFDVEGKSGLKTSGGDITIKDCAGSLDATTSGGDIVLKDHTGDISLYTSGGDISAKNARGKLTAKTSGGDIDLVQGGGTVLAKTSGGDIELRITGDNDGIELKTSGGDIDVFAKEGLNADLELDSSGGDVECDYPGTSASRVKSGYIRAKLNGGGPMIECRTSGGDVTFKKVM